MRKLFLIIAAGATFLSTYLSLRPIQVFLTYSDILFIIAGLVLVIEKTEGYADNKHLVNDNYIQRGWLIGTFLIIVGYVLSEIFSNGEGIDILIRYFSFEPDALYFHR